MEEEEEMARREVANETYYARNNHPNFNQFPRDYAYHDEMGRLYVIATQNKQLFQNARLAVAPRTHRDILRQPRRDAVRNSYGYVKLYVKLPSPEMTWFTRRDMNKSLRLTHAHSTQTIEVILKMDEKSNPRLRTGVIWVSSHSPLI